MVETVRERMLKGALAGFAATAPMTLSMTAMHRALPRSERYPLPPRLIVEQVSGRRVMRSLSEPQRVSLTLGAHFIYGAVTGALFPLLFRPRKADPVLAGTAYGLAVWAASYLGWIPAFGVLTPASQHPARRNLLMLAAHVVWGASLGVATALHKR